MAQESCNVNLTSAAIIAIFLSHMSKGNSMLVLNVSGGVLCCVSIQLDLNAVFI